MKQKIFFNVLKFDWPKSPVDLYIYRTIKDTGQVLYFLLFPNELERILSIIARNNTNKIYRIFSYNAEVSILLHTKLQPENPSLVKRYYNDKITYYISKKICLIVKKGFSILFDIKTIKYPVMVAQIAPILSMTISLYMGKITFGFNNILP